MARVANRSGLYAYFTTRIAANGASTAEVCSLCGSNFGFAVGPTDEIAYLRRTDPEAPVPPDGVAVVDGHADDRSGGTLILPDVLGALAYAPDGGLVVAGAWSAYSSNAGQPPFVVKMRAGQEAWRLDAPSGLRFVHFSRPHGVAVAADGTVVIAVRLQGNGRWGEDTVDAGTGRDYLVAVTADGRPRWARPMSALAFDPQSIQLAVSASGGNVYIAAANGCDTVSVHKYDAAGTWLAFVDLRMSSCRDASQAKAAAISASPTGVFVAGALSGTLHVGGGSITATADETAFLVKLSP